jgi:hypothetical protein
MFERLKAWLGLNGNGKVPPLAALSQFLTGKTPVSIEALQKAGAMDRTERAEMLLRLQESDEFYALVYEIMEAAETSREAGGKFIGVDDLMGALNIVFARAKMRVPPAERAVAAKKDPIARLREKVFAPILGRRGNRPWRGMTDRTEDEWKRLYADLEQQEKTAQ